MNDQSDISRRSSTADLPDRSGPSVFELVVFSGFLMSLSGASTDIMLPAFNAMASDLDTPIANVQATITAFVLPFGFGQIIYGSASDKYGRKPILAFGMSIFIVGALIAALGSNIETVLAGRALQGLGAASAPVLSRAILRDTHSGAALAGAMATSGAIFAFGPIIAPFVGFAVTAQFGWRYIFVFVGALSFLLLLFNLLRYRETNKNPDTYALSIRPMMRSLGRVLAHPQSRYYLGCCCLAYCALFTYIGNAPRIFQSAFGADGFDFAFAFALTGFGIVLGQLVNRALLPKFGILKMLKLASLILFVASTSILALVYFGHLNIVIFTIAMFCFNTSFLPVLSNTAALVLDPHPHIAGLTSALFGFATNATGGLFLLWSVSHVDGKIDQWGVVMVALTLMVLAGLWLPRKTASETNEN